MKKLSKNIIRRIIQEERIRLMLEQEELPPAEATGPNRDHHWPRIDWSDSVGEIVDKWSDMEVKAFDNNDPSMSPDDMPAGESKAYWKEQVEAAALDLENELTVEIRKLCLAKMKECTEKLIGGEYA